MNADHEEFEIALRLHLANDGRYKMILSMKANYHESARRNKLLPRGIWGLQKEILRRLKAKIRLLEQKQR
ncbi:MAG: hypothetical protein V4555_01765 [Acidobacteriota bacterium]